WRVLDRLKDDASTRHIPVQIITTDEETQRGLRMGAMGALTKPVKTKEALEEIFKRMETNITPRTRRLMVAQADESARQNTVHLLMGDDVEIVQTSSGEQVIAALKEGGFDAAVIALDLPEMKGFDLIDEINAIPEARDL